MNQTFEKLTNTFNLEQTRKIIEAIDKQFSEDFINGNFYI